MIYVATARWCDDNWAIAAGRDRDSVVRDADAYMAKHKAEYTIAGEFRNPDPHGRCAEDYIIEEVEESKP